MKRYLAFKGDVYYPGRGMSDFVGDFDTEEEAIDAVVPDADDEFCLIWVHVWDSELRAPVFQEQY